MGISNKLIQISPGIKDRRLPILPTAKKETMKLGDIQGVWGLKKIWSQALMFKR